MAITTAKGTQVKLGDGTSPEVFATIAEVRSVTGPEATSEIRDITTHNTVGFWRKKISVLLDPGTLSFDINFDSADATHAFSTGLYFLFVNLTKRTYKVVFPSSAGTLTFKAYVGQFRFSAPVDDVLQAAIQLHITEAITTS